MGRNIIVEPESTLSKLGEESEIIVPDHDNVLPDRGVVKSVGADVVDVIKVGDRVLFDRFRVDNLKDKGWFYRGEEGYFLVFPENLVLGIL